MKPDRLLPPGKSFRKLLLGYCLLLAFMLFVALSFSFPFSTALDNLYELHYGRRMLIEGAKIAPLDELWEHTLSGFWLLVLFCGLEIFDNYRRFYRESHSIYLMHRLPDRLELHRRCLTLPLLGILGGFLLCLLLAGLLILLYLKIPPECVLPEYFTFDLWRAIL